MTKDKSCAKYYLLFFLKRGHTKKPKQGDQQEKYCLSFHQFKCVINKQYNLSRTSGPNC